MTGMRFLFPLGAATFLVSTTASAQYCEAFSERHWGCGSLFCVIVDALAVPVSAVPRYDLVFGDGRLRQGLSWQVAIAVAPNLHSCHRWEHDLALEGAVYPFGDTENEHYDWALRSTWRIWIPGSPTVNSRDFTIRFAGGLGAYAGFGSGGPRLETRVWLGSAADSVRTIGLFVSGAYEPNLQRMRHLGQVSTGIELPFNI